MTDEEIEAKVIDIATHIWDKRDVVASQSLLYTHCTECEDRPFGLKTWCLPSITDLSTMCASCFVHKRIQELKAVRDQQAERDRQMPISQQVDYCNRVMRSNRPPASWRKPLDVDDFARI